MTPTDFPRIGQHVRGDSWRLASELHSSVEQLSSLASDLLPDFMDGSLLAYVTDPSQWAKVAKVSIDSYVHRVGGAVPVDMAGRGAARWIAASVQIALHLMAEYSDLMTLRDSPPGGVLRARAAGR